MFLVELKMTKISIDEILNSYQWKVSERILKQEFPWVINLQLVQPNFEMFSTIYSEIVINPYIFCKTNDTKIIDSRVYNVLIKKSQNDYRFTFLSTVFNISFEDYWKIKEKIEEILSYVSISNALPEELKLPRNRRNISVSNYVIKNNLSIADENYFEDIF